MNAKASPLPHSAPETLATLHGWQQEGRISALDLAFARFIAHRAPACPPLALLAAAIVSGQLSRGHVCLDLASPDAWHDWITEAFPRRSELARDHAPTGAGTGSRASSLLGDVVAALEDAPEAVRVVSGAEGQEDDGRPLVLVKAAGRARLYLARYWRAEVRVAAQVKARLARETPVPTDLAAALDRLFPKAGQGTDWQKLACALAARRALTLVTGGPGTGKTTTVIRLLALLQGSALSGGRALRIRLAAPTGKAAARLTASIAGQIAVLDVAEDVRAAIPAEVSTLHRLLGSRPDSRRFSHHAGRPLALDVLVVDEASMIDLELMAALLDALPEDARLVLLGDKDQLASVEAGAVLGDLCFDAEAGHYRPETADWLRLHAGQAPSAPGLVPGEAGRHGLSQQTVMLRLSRRFGPESAIGQLARAVNRGDGTGCRALLLPVDEEAELGSLPLADQGAFARLILEGRGEAGGYGAALRDLRRNRPADGDGEAAWQSWALVALAGLGRFQLLAALRDGPWGVAGLNRRIARILHEAGLVSGSGAWDGEWYEGRPVLATRNDYGLGIMNGDVGLCLNLAGQGLRVAFPDPDDARRVRFLHPSRLTSVQTAFAMTVHKAQGSEFDHAALALPDVLNPVLSRELVYTAVTRAKRHFTLLEHPGTVLESAVERRVERDSGLKELLWGG